MTEYDVKGASGAGGAPMRERGRRETLRHLPAMIPMGDTCTCAPHRYHAECRAQLAQPRRPRQALGQARPKAKSHQPSGRRWFRAFPFPPLILLIGEWFTPPPTPPPWPGRFYEGAGTIMAPVLRPSCLVPWDSAPK
eukprot:9485901-Pyramimonas_sp.AAC.1